MNASTTSTRVKLETILFATDFTAASDRAMDYALSLARYYDSKVVVAHIVPPEFAAGDGSDWYSAADRHRDASTLMETLADHLKDEEVRYETRVQDGSAQRHLLDLAEHNDADLIVMGTHGLHKVDRFILGSTAEGVLRSTCRPVLTVGPHVTHRPQYEIRLKKILLATELPPASDRAAQYAFSMAQEHQAEITLVHVLAPDSYLEGDVYRVMEEFKKELEEIVPPGSRDWCVPKCVLEYGKAADAIPALAKEIDADLIVMGARPIPAILAHFRAGVAYKVIANAPCPVLTICPKA